MYYHWTFRVSSAAGICKGSVRIVSLISVKKDYTDAKCPIKTPLLDFKNPKKNWRYFASIIRPHYEKLNPIISVCKPGFYNSTSNCLSRCGHCTDNATCDKEAGLCPNECEQHFKAPYCQGLKQNMLTSIKFNRSKLKMISRYDTRLIIFFSWLRLIGLYFTVK